jgi:hypothetical protein
MGKRAPTPAAQDLMLITADWLKEVGFRWHQLERQADKQWLLWLGGAIRDRLTSFEDLGLELSPRIVGNNATWHCWVRADTSHRYSRFLHIRPVSTRAEVIRLVEALSGQAWNPANHYAGNVYQPKHIAAIRRDLKRVDQVWRREGLKWSEVEKDDSRGRALPEHLDAHAQQMGQVDNTGASK